MSLPAPPGSCFGWTSDGHVRVCSFASAPGLYVLPNALNVAHQRELAVHAYTTLAHPQHDCSLHSTVHLPIDRTLLQCWQDSLKRVDSLLPCSAEEDGAVPAAATSAAHLQPADDTSACLESLPRDASGIERVLRRMRWIALGYRYNWSALSYDWGQQPQPLPECITCVADDSVALLRLQPIALQCRTYKPQAAVVNFYQIGDSLTSHVDRSEPAAAAPLVAA